MKKKGLKKSVLPAKKRELQLPFLTLSIVISFFVYKAAFLLRIPTSAIIQNTPAAVVSLARIRLSSTKNVIFSADQAAVLIASMVMTAQPFHHLWSQGCSVSCHLRPW